MTKKLLITAGFLFTLISVCFAQEVDITDALKKIESGNLEEANSLLQQLKQTDSNDPSVIFLDAVLSTDGNEAVKKYSSVFESFPQSQYADASLFRVFSYYYSIGSYKKAQVYLTKLKTDYPQSPYIAVADRNIPDIEEEITKPAIEISKPVQEETKVIQTEELKPSLNKFTIQAGAFLNADNAKRLCDLLIKDGYQSEITSREIGGGMLKVVSAGRFTTEDEAKKALASIEAKYNLKGRVIPLTNK